MKRILFQQLSGGGGLIRCTSGIPLKINHYNPIKQECKGKIIHEKIKRVGAIKWSALNGYERSLNRWISCPGYPLASLVSMKTKYNKDDNANPPVPTLRKPEQPLTVNRRYYVNGKLSDCRNGKLPLLNKEFRRNQKPLHENRLNRALLSSKPINRTKQKLQMAGVRYPRCRCVVIPVPQVAAPKPGLPAVLPN